MTSRFHTPETNRPESSMTLCFAEVRQVAVPSDNYSIWSGSSECGTAGGEGVRSEVCHVRLSCCCSGVVRVRAVDDDSRRAVQQRRSHGDDVQFWRARRVGRRRLHARRPLLGAGRRPLREQQGPGVRRRQERRRQGQDARYGCYIQSSSVLIRSSVGIVTAAPPAASPSSVLAPPPLWPVCGVKLKLHGNSFSRSILVTSSRRSSSDTYHFLVTC